MCDCLSCVVAIPLVAAGSNRVMGNLYDVQAQKQFAESTRELVDSVRGIRDVLQGNTVEVGSGFVDGELERPLMFTHGESLFVFIFVCCLCVYLFVCLFVCLFICLSVCLS